jgi:splicing factor U2AF subunit
MYHNPAAHMAIVDHESLEYDEKESQEHFEEFYEDIFTELSKFGEVEDINVCANLGDHLMGNVYVRFAKEEVAQNALEKLQGRYYAGN